MMVVVWDILYTFLYFRMGAGTTHIVIEDAYVSVRECVCMFLPVGWATQL